MHTFNMSGEQPLSFRHLKASM